MKRKHLPLLSLLCLLLLWQGIANWVAMPELLPTLPRLLATLGGLLGSHPFYQAVGATILRGFIGMLLSLGAALLFAYLFTRKEWIYELFRPILAILRSIPVISFILLALIFLHTESIPLLIAFLTMFPLLTENLTKGLRCQRRELSILAHQFRLSRWNRFTQLHYPQLKPYLFSGLASAVGFGWRAIIMGEVLAQCSTGIGGEMKQAQLFLSVPELISWTIVAIAVSYLFDNGIRLLSRYHFPIRYASRRHPDPEVNSKASIELEDLSFQFGSTPILSHFNYRFMHGNCYALMAPSGRGKTTLLQLLGGILQPTSGILRSDYSGGIATVLQEPVLFEELTIRANIALPLANRMPEAAALQRAEEVLQLVELTELADRYPGALSYGQQQRAALARAWAYDSPLLLLDEPFNGLDQALTHRIIERLRKQQDTDRRLIIFSSHDATESELLADQKILF